MLKNTVQPVRAQLTIRRMCIVCWIPRATDTHTHGMCDTFCLPTATKVARTRLNVTLYVHYQSCSKLMSSLICSCINKKATLKGNTGVEWSMELHQWLQYRSKLSDLTHMLQVSPTAQLDVMVNIHGGGFFSGTGASYLWGPQYLLDKDIVLVTFNYRLGALGQ